jgi:hypothetical protein
LKLANLTADRSAAGGLHFEIGPDGDMQLLIQFHKPSPKEKRHYQMVLQLFSCGL